MHSFPLLDPRVWKPLMFKSACVCKIFYAMLQSALRNYSFDFVLLSKTLFTLRLTLYIYIHTFIHSVISLTTGPTPLPKRFLHIVRSRVSSFNWEYPLLSLRFPGSFLRLLPRLFVTSLSPFIFPSITFFIRQFLRKMWPIQLAFRFLISCRIILLFIDFK